MRKVFLLAVILMFAGTVRVTAQKNSDFHKWEAYGGYLHGQNNYSADSDTFDFGPGGVQNVPFCSALGTATFGANFQKLFCDRNGFNGFDGSVTYNVSRYLGVKADFTYQHRSATYVDSFGPGHTDTSNLTENKYEFMGGVQLKDNSPETRFKPFAQALAGVAREKLSGHNTSTDPTEPPSNFTDTPTSFALKLGGGLDVRVSRRIDLRLIEVDYNPIFGRDRPLKIDAPFTVQVMGHRADNFTFGVGIVFH